MEKNGSARPNDITPALTAAITRHRAAYAIFIDACPLADHANERYDPAFGGSIWEEAEREETAALNALLSLPVHTLADIRAKAAYIAELPAVVDNIIDGNDWLDFLVSLTGERIAA